MIFREPVPHPMPKDTIEGFVLSPPQAELQRLRDAEPGDPWRTVCAVHVTGDIHAGALLEGLTKVGARHEILRTRLETLPRGTTAQVVENHPAITVEKRDLRHADDAARVAAVEALLAPAGTGGPCVGVVLASFTDTAHLLVLDFPAFMADPAAAWIVVDQLASVMAGASLDTSPSDGDDEDDDEPMQYADVAQWMVDMFASEEAEAGLAHWQALDLTGLLETRLPLELPAPAGAPFRPEEEQRELPPAVRDAVRAAASRLDTTPAALHLAAWQVLLARQTEHPRPVTGVVLSGRGYEGLDVVPGLFRRTLPLAVEVSAAQTFAALVHDIVRHTAEAEDQLEFFNLARSAPTVPFLPWSFAGLSAPDAIERGGVTWQLAGRRAVTARFRLQLTCDETAERTVCRMGYDPASFAAGDAARLLAQYVALLANAAADVRAPVGTLSEVDEAEHRLLTQDFARIPTRSAPILVTEHIAARAVATPDAVAVAAEGRTLTYGELDARATDLARHLQERGTAPNTFVGIHMTRSPEMIVAILGVLKAGAAYLPLPPSYPRERLSFMLEDAGAPLVLTRAADGADFAADTAEVLVLEELAAPDDVPLEREPAPGDLAYVIYTSGSTGLPKGVPISHGNLAASTGARFDHYEHPVTGYLLLSSFAFDSSVPGIFWTLCQGGRLVLPPEHFEEDITELGRLIAQHGTSHLLGLPSVYSLILEHARPGQLDSLTTVIVAGEACPRELVERHYATLPTVALHNEYGPTEGTVWSTVHDCAAGARRPQVPIGRPVPGVDVYILDEAGRPAAIGLAGELHIGGVQLSPGYLGRPDLNAEKFIADPFRGEGRLYRTGDRARFLSDGTIEFLGRIDHQVKVRGFRIELEEIETILMDHPDVREAVVEAREDTPGDQRLAAYVTSAPGSGLDIAALEAHLAGPLPAYMVPNHFVVLDDLPRLPNGKVDRRALPDPRTVRTPAAVAPTTAQTALQRVMAGIWAEVLGEDTVGIDDDFFELGGHSLLATQLFARLRDMLQITAPLRLLFDNSTIADLTRELTADPAEGQRLERTAELMLQVLGMAKE